MYYTATRIPSNNSLHYNNYNAALQRVHQVSARDGEKLSPVDLAISRATMVQLPPLDWAHYQVTPSNMTVRNSGFTVMINAIYDRETPFVSSGPLMGNYVFSQIHFHWGEHNETGSGHSVDGIRYPLEMHVVHLRKDCANLGEAFKSKDGIAVVVHLFALREERNTQLDQLTAILQFIKQPKCCARLYPIPLSEIVHPFTNDYFLYWGAVGSPRGQYRILWLVSRNVLPVSTQQLEEFRHLKDPQGKSLVSNSSKPQPLAGRSLFLVSPSDRTDVTMYGVYRQRAQGARALDSEDSIDIGNAEYKSLAALDDTDHKNCRICPAPTRLKHIANINVGYPIKVNEGDTSVEESCVDLGNSADNSRVTVKTEMKYKDDTKGQKVITNVNVMTCRHKRMPKYSPSEALYSVISAKGSELHLKRKPLFVRQNDPSTEQACVLLSNRSSTYPTYSAPSLTSTGGFLTIKQEHTDLSDPPFTNFSSEVAVHLRDSESEADPGRGNVVPTRKERPLPAYLSYANEVEKETNFEETFKSSKKAKKVRIQGYNDVDDLYKENPYIPVNETPQIGSLNVPIASRKDIKTLDNQIYSKTQDYGEYYKEEEQDISSEKEQTKYVLVKEKKNNKPFYKIVGELPKNCDSNQVNLDNDINSRNNNRSIQKYNHTNNEYTNEEILIKRDRYDDQNTKIIQSPTQDLKSLEPEGENYPNDYLYQNLYQNETYEEKHKEVRFKQNSPLPLPSTSQKSKDAKNKDKDIQPQPSKKTKKTNIVTHQELESDSHYRVSLVVRTTVSDHRKPGQKRVGAAQTYVVTKISPVEKSTYLTPKHSGTEVKKCFGKKPTSDNIEHLYYGRPAREPEDQQRYPEKTMQSLTTETYQRRNTVEEQDFTSEYYKESMEDIHKQSKKEGHLTIQTNQNDVTNENKEQQSSHERNANTAVSIPKKIQQDPGIQDQNIYDEELYENENRDFHQHQSVHYKLNKNSAQLQNPELNQLTPKKHLAIPESKPKQSTQNLIESNKSIYKDHSKNTNLIQKVNVYQGKNDPNEDVRIIDKTIVGKIGESQSTDVFLKSQHIEVVSPEKTDVTKEKHYNLVRSKYPEPQYYVKEPPNKSQPKSIIRQHLSLDQQIKGYSQVRQTVEYHDRTRPKTTNIVPSSRTLPERQHSRGRTPSNNRTEIYEESNQEQSSTFQKIQQQTHKQFKTSQPTNEDIDPVDNTQVLSINALNNEQKTNGEKNKTLTQSAIDPKCVLPSTFIDTKTEESLEQLESSKIHSKKLTSKNIVKNVNDSNDPAASQHTIGHTNYVPNTGYNSFEYEETSSENKLLEHSKHEKKLKLGIQAVNSKELLDPTNSKKTLSPHKKPIDGVVESKPSVSKQQLMEWVGKHVTETDPGVLHSDNLNKLKNIDSKGVEFEEVFEENVVQTSQKTREKKVTAQVRGEPTYKFPTPTSTETSKPESQHSVVIKKVKIPEPHFVTRVPKQPLVEYEAFPVNPQQPFEIITETLEEISSVAKTNKTFMMFKKINGKAVLNQPSIIEPMRIQVNNSKEKPLSPNSSMKTKNIVSVDKGQLNRSDQVAVPHFYNEKYELHENMSEQEKKKFIQRTQIQSYNNTTVDPNKYLHGTNEDENAVKKLPENNNVEVKKSPQKHKDPENIPIKTSHTQPTIPKNNLTEFEYSETSLISEQRFTQKEKKYKYKIIQSPLYEEDNLKPLTDNEKPAASSGTDASEGIVYNDPRIDSKFLAQRTELESGKTDNITKIVMGSYKKPISPLNSPQPTMYADNVIPRENNKFIDINPPILRTKGDYTQPGYYIDEDYYESSIKDHKHESVKKQLVSSRRAPRIIVGQSQPGPSHQYPQYLHDPSKTYSIKDSKYPEIHDKPTKDTSAMNRLGSDPNEDGVGFKIESLSEDYESNNKKSLVYQRQYTNERGSIAGDDKGTPFAITNLNGGTIPITKTDGDIVIYIRQPKMKKEHITPKITVDVSNTNPMTPSELDTQTVQVHEIKPVSKNKKTVRKPISPRKSKSADVYRSSLSSGTSEDEEGGNLNTDSNEEQVIDTTHYNLTLKSGTQVDLPTGRSAHIKSEVTIKPLSRPGTPTKPRGVQEVESTTDECCSAVRITEIPESSSLGETSEQDDGAINHSPIKIDTESSVVRRYPKLRFFNQWDAQGNALLENNGRTLRGSYIDDTKLPYLQGGPVEGVYIFTELHFHWGHKDCCGAEHIIDGQRHTLEAHFMYIKREYGSLKNAMNYSDGLAIVAVILIVGGPPNPLLEELIKDMPLLREANTGTYVPAASLFSWIKPTVENAQGYFSYKGSMAQFPPYVEAVTWIIFPEPILFCCQQSCEFRKLKSTKGELLKKNYRTPQPLNNRPVYYVPL